MSITFKVCPRCNGYGVMDNGNNCHECGGHGHAGDSAGTIGSGEIMFDSKTGERVTAADLVRRLKAKEGVQT